MAKDSVKLRQTTLDSFCKFTDNVTQQQTELDNNESQNNRDTLGSGSEWSGGESDSDSPEEDFITLPEELLTARDVGMREHAQEYEDFLYDASSKAK